MPLTTLRRDRSIFDHGALPQPLDASRHRGARAHQAPPTMTAQPDRLPGARGLLHTIVESRAKSGRSSFVHYAMSRGLLLVVSRPRVTEAQVTDLPMAHRDTTASEYALEADANLVIAQKHIRYHNRA